MSQPKGRSFAEASKQIQENLDRHISKYEKLLEEEASDESDGEENADELLENVLRSYGTSDQTLVQSTKELLRTALQSSSCLICIETIKKLDPVWNCETCYASLHLYCTQKWSKDSIFLLKQQQEEDPSKEISLHWSCPNCRSIYLPSQVPSRYLCFCRKETDPRFDPWLTPHSCGEKCGKALQPECKHKCILLCHPGPCPPCPQTVKVSCYCGKSSPTIKRCSASSWTCNTGCGRLLSCGVHTCPLSCHPGPCAPCSKTSTQSCCCGRAKEPRPCSSPTWNCGTKCGKLLKCESHSCEHICHVSGECPPCPLSLVRHCPCGKSDYSLPCTQATPTCGDTCAKILACGTHYCAERCHRGACPQCLQLAKKSCRCGNKVKEIQCAKQFTCENKCKRTRDCRKHPCNKKCCDGNCPPCEQMCGKTLNCKNHKCMSRCHQGPCYPCTNQRVVACNCEATKVKVPCGKEKTTKPPKCRKVCTTKTNCHHEERTKHLCHPGACPPCKKICNSKLDCQHLCPVSCHDNVQVKLPDKGRPAGPWEEKNIYEVRKLACPPCNSPVPIPCLGQHEIADFPCHEAKPASCGRRCGRNLPCTNHTCQRDCHRVRHAKDEFSAGINCKKCESACEFSRPPGCQHACSQGCHPGECSPCTVNLKLKCHCGINNQFVRCAEYTSLTPPDLAAVLSCQDQCPKLMECGHRCLLLCHAGPCSPISQCKKKVKVTCACKRKKEDFRCFNVNSGQSPVSCDQDCELQKREQKNKVKMSDVKAAEEDEHSRREAEIFEKQMEGGKRKRRNRRRETESEVESPKSNLALFIASAMFLLVVVGYSLSKYL